MKHINSTLSLEGTPVTRPKLTDEQWSILGNRAESMGRLDLEQGSLEWKLARTNYITASEVAGICGEAAFGPNSMQKVLMRKRGQIVEKDNAAMAHGRAMEPIARAMLEKELGISIPPAVRVRGRVMASLDGWCERTRTLVEIKCPYSLSQFSDEVPAHYIAQLATQAWVTCPEKILFAQYHGGLMNVISVSRAYLLEKFLRDYAGPIVEAYEHLKAGTLPQEEMSDPDWIGLANHYKELLAIQKDTERLLDDVKDRLIKMAEDSDAFGYGVSVKWVTREGSVNWKAREIQDALLGAGVNAEEFRAKPTRYAKIVVEK